MSNVRPYSLYQLWHIRSPLSILWPHMIPAETALNNSTRILKSIVSLAPKVGLLAKVYIGANHQAGGWAVRWSRNGDDIRRHTSSGTGILWRHLNAARRFVDCPASLRFNPTSSGYTLDEIAAQQVVVGRECDGGVGGDSRNATH